ncbi:50S ribosomal protein L4 [Alienimonas californiensis]|uniref:Large ribosomal subunit protein uL4 n=1 Tax=Alienimonas californiensis TaxID=2527989 RepID=A0A517P9J3_9PLAN|nr:50S ribosomal protein L4 [Alienimonas californiensis]QDT16032.1 50S ribosomal protein L4 [Alienimonas californiensis]
MAAISVPVLGRDGGETGTYDFDGDELASAISKQLLHDAVVMYERNKRQGTVATRSRGMVAGSTKKMYRQKGTGRARMGAKRTPIRRGGGVTFAIKPKDWYTRMPRKAVRLATRMSILSKFQDGQAVVLENFELDEPRTKLAADRLKSLGLYDQSALLAIDSHDPLTWRACRNLEALWVRPVGDLNAYDVLHQRQFVITVAALDALLGRVDQRLAA